MVQIGAGPSIGTENKDTTEEYNDKQDMKSLEEIINNSWNFDKTAFRGFASTSPVCKIVWHQYFLLASSLFIHSILCITTDQLWKTYQAGNSITNYYT